MDCDGSSCLLKFIFRIERNERNNMVIIGVAVGAVILTAFIIITNILLACKRARQNAAQAQQQAQNFEPSPNNSSQSTTINSAARRRLRSSPLPYFQAQPPAVIRMQRAQNIPGLTMQELDTVAPVKPFAKNHSTLNSNTDQDDDDSDEENTCAVCLEEMKTDIPVREMPNCGHVFHTHCIEEWATKANRCPVCNTNIIAEEKLEKVRTAIREGRDPNAPPPPRQRRRRTRAPTGGYHLHDAAETIVNPDNVQPLQSVAVSNQQSTPPSLLQTVPPVGSDQT